MADDIINDYTYKDHSFWNFKGRLDFVDRWFLMSTPFPMITITVLYLLVVLKLGPVYMKTRKPFGLKKILVAYNSAQVLLSAYMFYLCNQIMIPNGFVGKTCLLETEDNRQKMSKVMYIYFLAKITELLDTIFFILRKKDSQVTFLHVYHHAIMVVITWSILKYEPTYTSLFIRNINSFVHVVMYTYYGLSAFPSMAKYLWWKKYITAIQLVQFSLVLIHFIISYMTSECRPSFTLCFTIVLNAILFFFLFSQFYIRSYIEKGESKKIDADHHIDKDKNGYHNGNNSTKSQSNDNEMIFESNLLQRNPLRDRN